LAATRLGCIDTGVDMFELECTCSFLIYQSTIASVVPLVSWNNCLQFSYVNGSFMPNIPTVYQSGIPTFYQCAEVDMQIFCMLLSFWGSRVQLVHEQHEVNFPVDDCWMTHLLLGHIFSCSVKDHSCPRSYTFSHLVRYLYKDMLLNLLWKYLFPIFWLSHGLWFDSCCRLPICS
jgi:hypothetical protein